MMGPRPMSVDWDYTREWIETLAQVAISATAVVVGVLGIRRAIEETRKAAAEADKARCEACALAQGGSDETACDPE